ncbi:Protein of unknown function DUF111 [Lachnospiraceae bacterium NK3A20]|nr:Protein of unknown function DUF111 [Lachnospiraceae bacterium NK3A20]
MSKLYLECYSGISGDMTVGALLDLGADPEVLQQVLTTVPVQGFTTKISTVQKSSIDACDFEVILDEENHDHDMAYLYGTDMSISGDPEHHHHHHHNDDEDGHHHHHHHEDEHHGHHHDDEEEEEHCHKHHHDDEECCHKHNHDDEECCHHHHHHHDGEECCHKHHHDGEECCHHHHHDDEGAHGHHHEHVHRNLADVIEIINGTQMTDGARELAIKIFTIVARAESEVHGKPLEEVHFHEVGAIDSIVDIIAIAVCYDNLRTKENITDVIVPVLYEGHGTVRTQHGLLPIPVPAVTAIVRSNNIGLHLIPDEGEFVTPTGAAAVAALRTSDQLPESFKILRTGLGAGKRAYRRAGVVRAMLIAD